MRRWGDFVHDLQAASVAEFAAPLMTVAIISVTIDRICSAVTNNASPISSMIVEINWESRPNGSRAPVCADLSYSFIHLSYLIESAVND